MQMDQSFETPRRPSFQAQRPIRAGIPKPIETSSAAEDRRPVRLSVLETMMFENARAEEHYCCGESVSVVYAILEL